MIAKICFAVSTVAEFAGAVILVVEAREARAASERFLHGNPERHVDGSYSQLTMVSGGGVGLLGNGRRRAIAIGLVLIGLIAGTVGNFLTV